MFNQESGTVRPLLTTLGVNAIAFQNKIEDALARLPQVQGVAGDVQPSSDLMRHLNLCDQLAQKHGDDFISSELFLLAALEANTTLADMLKAAGVNKDNLKKAIEQMRGGEKVNDQSAEDQRQALKNILLI